MLGKLYGIFFRAGIMAWSLFMIAGCATVELAEDKYGLRETDVSKGIVVGTVFERAVFTPYGATFYISTPSGERLRLTSGAERRRSTIVNVAPKRPTGAGMPFALQLPPGKYTLTDWSLSYGSSSKKSDAPDMPIEFVVEAGKVIYLGRFDANRFMENSYLHDNYAEDAEYFRKMPLLSGREIENRALKYQGWWLPNAAGKEMAAKGERTEAIRPAQQ